MKVRKPPAFFAILLALIALSLGAQTRAAGTGGNRPVQFPPVTPGPEAQKYAALPESALDSWETLGEIALWASGATGPGFDQALSRLRAATAELGASPDLPDAVPERGEYVLTFMHRRLLKGYSENQTRLDEIFVNGRYNCVSSAALYMLLAVSVGLDVRGVAAKDHAFATVHTGNDIIDVETTNPYGFDPGNRKEFLDGFGEVTGFAYVPAKNYRDRVAINRLELVSLILSNRIAALEKSRRTAEAVPLGVDRRALLWGKTKAPESSFFPSPQETLAMCLLNYGAELVNSGREEDALAWADLVSSQYPGQQQWEDFTYTAVNNMLAKALRNQDMAAAENISQRFSSRLRAENAGKIAALVAEAKQVQAENHIVRLVNNVKTAQDYSAALSAIAAAQGIVPAARLGELRTGAERNRSAALHNNFATLFNRRSYQGAKEAAEAALGEFPGNKQFAEDLQLAERALQGR
jgi:hypothetical protein